MFGSTWPPDLSNVELESMTLLATTYAMSHGLLMLPCGGIPTSAVHAPLSLFPTPYPRRFFNQAIRLQRFYNIIYSRIALDADFLDDIMNTDCGVGQVDEFVRQLWTGWKKLRVEGRIVQPLQLGLFRSDYMLHAPSDSEISLKQIEFNTIASSSAALAEATAAMHRYLFGSTGYFGRSRCIKEDNFPPNHATSGLAEGLAEAHKAYNNPAARILFVVQAGERNLFDQRKLEYELQDKYSIYLIRQTLDELATSATLEEDTKALIVMPSFSMLSPSARVEISIVYFRAGYNPVDYPTSTHYATRLLLERSKAIKCPSIAMQLAGSKKVQQVLAKPGVLERFLDEKRWGDGMSLSAMAGEIRDNWMEMWGLDEDGPPGEDGVSKVLDRAENSLLKPQREGGGYNVCEDAIPAFIQSLPPRERKAWIAMEFVRSPEGTRNYLVRHGQITKRPDVIGELGIYGWSLYGTDNGVIKEKEVGWLVRTKQKGVYEGNLNGGLPILDSLVLVDEQRGSPPANPRFRSFSLDCGGNVK